MNTPDRRVNITVEIDDRGHVQHTTIKMQSIIRNDVIEDVELKFSNFGKPSNWRTTADSVGEFLMAHVFKNYEGREE